MHLAAGLALPTGERTTFLAAQAKQRGGQLARQRFPSTALGARKDQGVRERSFTERTLKAAFDRIVTKDSGKRLCPTSLPPIVVTRVLYHGAGEKSTENRPFSYGEYRKRSAASPTAPSRGFFRFHATFAVKIAFL